jgi:hypothetical protein
VLQPTTYPLAQAPGKQFTASRSLPLPRKKTLYVVRALQQARATCHPASAAATSTASYSKGFKDPSYLRPLRTQQQQHVVSVLCTACDTAVSHRSSAPAYTPRSPHHKQGAVLAGVLVTTPATHPTDAPHSGSAAAANALHVSFAHSHSNRVYCTKLASHGPMRRWWPLVPRHMLRPLPWLIGCVGAAHNAAKNAGHLATSLYSRHTQHAASVRQMLLLVTHAAKQAKGHCLRAHTRVGRGATRHAAQATTQRQGQRHATLDPSQESHLTHQLSGPTRPPLNDGRFRT